MKKQKRMSKFECGGKSVKIKYTKELLMSNQQCLGFCDLLQNAIYIRTVDPHGFQLPEDTINHTLWHEISHYLLYCMGEGELCMNEKFIDLLGSFLNEIQKSKK